MASTGLIYLQKDKFDIYSLTTARLYEFRFVPEIVRDLEVMNFDLLENLIKLFIANNKIAPENISIILSDNACFIKDFMSHITPPNAAAAQPTGTSASVSAPVIPVLPNQDELIEQSKEFIEHVPFDKVVSKVIPISNGIKVVAVNLDFYEAFKTAFEKLGFKVNAVIPGIVFGNGISTKPVLDIVTANTVLQQTEAVKEYDLLNQVAFVAPTKQSADIDKGIEVEEKPKKKNNKRVFVMLGVFGVLIGILLLVLVLNPNK